MNLKSFLFDIVREIIVRAPFKSKCKNRALFNKYIKPSKIKGKNILLTDNIKILRRNKAIYGSNILLKGKAYIDATAGLAIGDNNLIDRKVNISTRHEDGSYDPVVIGAGNNISEQISPGTIVDSTIPVNGLSSYKGQLVFILSTGRSGSKAIANLLNQHTEAECYHDAFAHLNTWSCDLLYHRKSREEIKNKLKSLYNAMELGKYKVHGQSDQKIAPLIPVLNEIFPNAKFIWLIRNPYDFVNSAYARGWFDNSEFGYLPNAKEFLQKMVTPLKFDADHRCNGSKIGVLSEAHWKSMTAFERICWYWTFWNNLIKENIERVPDSKVLKVKLEELEDQKNNILDFVDLPSFGIIAEKVNTAYYRKPDVSQWTAEMNKIFERQCGDKMKQWGY